VNLTRTSLLLAVGLVALTLVAAGVLRLADAGTPRPVPVASRADPAAPPPDEALAVLHAWDRARADAWAAGDARALGALYTPGSAAGRRDVAMLRRWSDRGLVVRGMAMQVLDARLRVRTADRMVVVVTDRLTGAVAVGPGVRRPLPEDRASTRTLTLRRGARVWQVVSVRE
jgi:hypothetical protein